MKKRILSLFIALTMIVAVVPGFSVVLADGDPEVTYGFYYDEELTNPIGDASVEVGTIVYGAFSAKNVTAVMVDPVIGFDTRYLEPISFADDSVVELRTITSEARSNPTPETRINVTAGELADGSKGVKILEVKVGLDALTCTPDEANPEMGMANSTSNIGVLYAGFNNYAGVNLGSGKTFVVMKFRAKKQTPPGNPTLLYSPTAEQSDYYDNRDDGASLIDTSFQVWSAYQSDSFYKKLKVNEAALTIIYTSSLGTPTNLNIDGRNISWYTVDGVDGYEVTLTPTNSNTAEVKVIKTATPSATIPEDIKYGDVAVSVRAYKEGDGDTEYSASLDGNTLISLTLAAPTKVEIENGTTAKWTPVESAQGYELTIYENDVQKGAPVSVGAGITEYNISDYLSVPAEGKNEYYVSVKPTGDGTYVIYNGAAVSSDKLYKLGAVGAPTELKWTGNKATWEAPSVAADKVGGYVVKLYNLNGAVTDPIEVAANVKSYDFSEQLKDASDYFFSVKAVGKDTSEGRYSDSAFVDCTDGKRVTETLKPVTITGWGPNERVVTWSDENTNSPKSYEVTLYKVGETEDTFVTKKTVQEPTIDFDTIDPDPIDQGDYKVVIVAKGDGIYYLDSTGTERTESFDPRLGLPTNLRWDDTSAGLAKWDPVPGAGGYEVVLYYNGEYKKFTPDPITGTQYDFSGNMDIPGFYTFSVKALGTTTHAPSDEVKSDDTYNPNVARVGDAVIKIYEDSACTTPKNTITAGEKMYVAVSLKNATGADLKFTGATIPISYSPEYVKIDSAAVFEGLVSDSNKSLTGFSKIERGLAYVTIYAADETPKTIADNDEEIIAVFEADALLMTDSTDIKIAVAGANQKYTNLAPGGLLYSYDDVVNNTSISRYASAGSLNISINKGKLPKMDAPVWKDNGIKTITWSDYDTDELDGIVTNYHLKLYKDGNVIKELDVPYGTLERDMSEYMSGTGNYTVSIQAISNDPAVADDSDDSDESEAYVVSSSGGGGRVLVSSYNVNVPKEITGGTVSVSPKQAVAGRNITVTATPEDGYKLSAIKVTDKDGNEVAVRESGGKYNFVMPESDVTVEPVFEKIGGGDETPEFTDIEGHWAEEFIRRIAEMGLVSGYGDGTFRPDWGITRAEFTKLMVDCLGWDVTDEEGAYEDTKDHWAKNYINRGTELGIVFGIGDNLFAPDVIITREQIAAILFRMSGKPDGSPISDYVDRDEITEYAKPAVDYVTARSFMIGMENKHFRGLEQTTRAQVATILVRLFNAGYFDELDIKNGNSIFEKGDFTSESFDPVK